MLKALNTTMNRAATNLPESRALDLVSVQNNKDVVVEWPGQKPDYNG